MFNHPGYTSLVFSEIAPGDIVFNTQDQFNAMIFMRKSEDTLWWDEFVFWSSKDLSIFHGRQAGATALLRLRGFTGNDSQLRAFVGRLFTVDPKKIAQHWTR